MCLQFIGRGEGGGEDRAGDLDLAATGKYMAFASVNIWKWYMRLSGRVRRGSRTEAKKTDHAHI